MNTPERTTRRPKIQRLRTVEEKGTFMEGESGWGGRIETNQESSTEESLLCSRKY
jgi:hypothetical protein